jgi:hypothetical protein
VFQDQRATLELLQSAQLIFQVFDKQIYSLRNLIIRKQRIKIDGVQFKGFVQQFQSKA